MKKHLLSAAVGIALTTVSFTSNAEDLAQIYRLAVDNDPTLLRAAAERNATQKGVDIAKSGFLPQVNGEAGYSESTSDSPQFVNNQIQKFAIDSSGWQAGVTLNQSIFDWSVWKNADIAEKQAYQAEISYSNAQQELMLRVVNAYFQALQAKDDLSFAEAEKKAIKRQLEQTKQRFSVGLTAITDVHEAQAQYDSAVAREIQARNAVEIAYESIREITGQYPQTLAALDTETFSPSDPAPEDVMKWVKKAENSNLSLLESMVQVEIAEQQIKLQQAGHYPTVSLSANYSANDIDRTIQGEPSPDTGRLDSRSIGLNVSVPIFSGFRTSAEVSQARDNYVASSQQMVQTRRQIEREVRNAYYEVSASIASISAFQQSVVSAESALKATEAGFEVGTRTIVDVLNSTQNLYNAKRNLSEARYGYIRQMLRLEQAAGQLQENDLLAINSSLSEDVEGTAAD
ncbi:outer membrane channel protein TolC [Idiomarina sp. X4]|uniref:outer membrane channel protein TolC n=1 Tax=unclassified Idiomarina TaxID=2614829 RepID=UPI0007339C19|nr:MULTISPECIES: outer membrane channel protein TolC [unclassified Idiomarina]KTG30085.1 outer membrane channel protein [Idiomarina sp. H105]OAF14478.1 outer membrane channel protein [Idiomarina sp. WRN-38]ATZ73779.1 outer membrane channel protein TolC [Idiomarina sp. X4]MCJ8316929.1 outer membrane channel protein TolC [Idiomarina sp.]NQZ16619.1 outer membrane channel protein TolC [Idiomarina sp.]